MDLASLATRPATGTNQPVCTQTFKLWTTVVLFLRKAQAKLVLPMPVELVIIRSSCILIYTTSSIYNLASGLVLIFDVYYLFLTIVSQLRGVLAMKYGKYSVRQRLSEWFFAGFLLLVTSLAQGSYTGPGSDKAQGAQTGHKSNTGTTTVANILKMPRDNMRVELIGNLVRKIRHENYMFSDGTGEIRVDIDDDEFPAQAVQADTRVEIMGEVDMDHRSDPEIDVKWLRIVQ